VSQGPSSFDSLDQALAEIQRLRARVSELEAQLAPEEPLLSPAAPALAPHAQAAPAAASASAMRALEQFAEQIEHVRRLWREAAHDPPAEAQAVAPPPPEVPAVAAPDASAARLAAIRQESDEAAARQLEEMRDAIQRLRAERTQASIELLNLTRGSRDRHAAAREHSTSEPSARTGVVERAWPARAPIAHEPPASSEHDEPNATVPSFSGAEALPDDMFPSEHGSVSAPIPSKPAPADWMRDVSLRQLTPEPPPSSRRWPLFWLAAASILAIAAIGAAAWWRGGTSPAASASRQVAAPETAAARPAAEPALAPEPAPPRDVTETAAFASVVPPSSSSSSSAAPDVSAGAAEPPAEAAAPPARAAAAPPPTGHRVELTLSRSSWMEITVDGRPRARKLMPAGSALAYDVDQLLELTAGDAGAVRVSIDGGPDGVLGRDGRVAKRAFRFPPAPSGR
jgi:hypothetical protein